MSALGGISGREAARAMLKLDYVIDHESGSHMILRQTAGAHRRLTIPDHRELAKGTMRAIIREAGLTVDQFTCLVSKICPGQ